MRTPGDIRADQVAGDQVARLKHSETELKEAAKVATWKIRQSELLQAAEHVRAAIDLIEGK